MLNIAITYQARKSMYQSNVKKYVQKNITRIILIIDRIILIYKIDIQN